MRTSPSNRSAQPPASGFYRQEFQNLSRPSRGWARTSCCFHHGDNPTSLALNIETGGFYCHACGAKGGDLIDFIMLRDGLSFKGAAKRLGAWDESGRVVKPTATSNKNEAGAIAKWEQAERELRLHYRDEMHLIRSLGARILVSNCWANGFLEMSELVSMRRSEIERIKAFLTARIDHFRPPYGRRAIDAPRQGVFAASTNDETPFVDSTGNRRFWPVRCGQIDVEAVARDRDQLWAEAYLRYVKGEPWWLDNVELNALAKAEQDERYEPGPWDSAILEWVEHPCQRDERQPDGHVIPLSPWDGSEPYKVTITDVLVHCVGKAFDRITPADYHSVARCLNHAGWRRKQDRKRGPTYGKRFYTREGQ